MWYRWTPSYPRRVAETMTEPAMDDMLKDTRSDEHKDRTRRLLAMIIERDRAVLEALARA